VLIHVHLNEDVAGQYLAGDGAPAATAYFYLVFRGDNHIEYFIAGVHELDALFQILLDALFMPGISVDNVPLFIIIRHG
jgi:hypothetical protein